MDEPCALKNCTYAVCRIRQLLDDGVCGKSIKRKTREDTRPEDFYDEEIRVKGKVMRKMGDRDIF
jgi:hypothetical protein